MIDGIEVFRIIRSLGSTAHVPVIMLTARASEDDRVAGLDLGTDDYIVKPFSLRELAARVRAVLRRSRIARAAGPQPLVYRSAHPLVDFEAVLVRVAAAHGVEWCGTNRVGDLRMTKVETQGPVVESAPPLTPLGWVICAIAAIGFAFDIYEILMLQLVVRPALLELTGAVPGSPEFQMWVGRLFYIPAFAGGIFGLLGGYLTDLFGRRRVLTFSILIYAGAAFASGYATSVEMLLVLRCLVFIGVCVEFVAAVAWLAELFPHPRQRERVLGYTQAFSSLGGLMVATANGLCVAYAASLPPIGGFGLDGRIADPHAAWRYTLMTGVIPAIPVILIRPFLPESPVWREKRAAGTLRRPSFAELFAPELRRTTLVTALMVAMAYGAAFGAINQVPQMVPGLPEVREMTAGVAPERASQITQEVAANVTKVQEIGGLTGRILLAWLVVRIASRRRLLRLFQVPGLVVIPFVFAVLATSSLRWLYPGIFLAGLLTVAQFSFWGNYLPRAYPVYLRGTGEAFAANIGGRLIGTCFAWVTAALATTADRAFAPTKVALVAAGVGFFVYLVGFIASFWLPEPRSQTAAE